MAYGHGHAQHWPCVHSAATATATSTAVGYLHVLPSPPTQRLLILPLINHQHHSPQLNPRPLYSHRTVPVVISAAVVNGSKIYLQQRLQRAHTRTSNPQIQTLIRMRHMSLIHHLPHLPQQMTLQQPLSHPHCIQSRPSCLVPTIVPPLQTSPPMSIIVYGGAKSSLFHWYSFQHWVPVSCHGFSVVSIRLLHGWDLERVWQRVSYWVRDSSIYWWTHVMHGRNTSV